MCKKSIIRLILVTICGSFHYFSNADSLIGMAEEEGICLNSKDSVMSQLEYDGQACLLENVGFSDWLNNFEGPVNGGCFAHLCMNKWHTKYRAPFRIDRSLVLRNSNKQKICPKLCTFYVCSRHYTYGTLLRCIDTRTGNKADPKKVFNSRERE